MIKYFIPLLVEIIYNSIVAAFHSNRPIWGYTWESPYWYLPDILGAVMYFGIISALCIFSSHHNYKSTEMLKNIKIAYLIFIIVSILLSIVYREYFDWVPTIITLSSIIISVMINKVTTEEDLDSNAHSDISDW